MPRTIAAAVNTEYIAQALYRVTLLKPLDYRELLNESDIKRTVAFFKMSFSISTRRSCFSNS